MKQLYLFIIYSVLLISHSCSGQQNNQETLILKEINFESIFGIKATDSTTIFCLLGTGFFRAPSSDNSDSLISSWIEKHPEAIVIPISSFGPLEIDKPESKLIYCWVIDENDTLNNFLIKNGCFPGGTMMRPDTWDEMTREEKSLYKDSNEKADINVYIDNKIYDAFIEQIKSAEIYARKNKLGIWLNETELKK